MGKTREHAMYFEPEGLMILFGGILLHVFVFAVALRYDSPTRDDQS